MRCFVQYLVGKQKDSVRKTLEGNVRFWVAAYSNRPKVVIGGVKLPFDGSAENAEAAV